jgi:hypothetical protein
MIEHIQKPMVDPEVWAAAQVEAVAVEVEKKAKRKRRKVRGVFLKPGKEAGVWWIRWWCNYGHRHEERMAPGGWPRTWRKRGVWPSRRQTSA